MNTRTYLLAVAGCVLAASPALAQSQNVSMSGITVDYSGDVSGNGSFSGATVDVSGSFGRDLEVSGAAVDIDAVVGGELEASGGAISVFGNVEGDAELSGGAVEISLQVGGESEISGGAVEVSPQSVFTGYAEISVGALEFSGHAMSDLDVDFGDMEFSGRADGVVDFDGNSREGIFRRRDRSEIEISGVLNGGGEICAHEVRFTSGAEVNEALTVHADSEPEFADGFDSGNVRYVERDRQRCRD
jgi:cytoskeletal protein CcmA (bactofilin family)